MLISIYILVNRFGKLRVKQKPSNKPHIVKLGNVQLPIFYHVMCRRLFNKQKKTLQDLPFYF